MGYKTKRLNDVKADGTKHHIVKKEAKGSNCIRMTVVKPFCLSTETTFTVSREKGIHLRVGGKKKPGKIKQNRSYI